MRSNQTKVAVLSWLLLSFAGLIATILSIPAGAFQPVFAFSPLIAVVMLSWIQHNKNIFTQPFYRLSWYLNLLFFVLTLLMVVYWFASLGIFQ
jgi:hypothetical protein